MIIMVAVLSGCGDTNGSATILTNPHNSCGTFNCHTAF